MKTQNLIYILPLALLLACGSESSETETATAETENELRLSPASIGNLSFSLETPEKRRMSRELLVNGQIDVPPEQRITLTLPYPGKITAIPVLPGMRVQKGALLLEIENPEFLSMQQEYLVILSDLEFAEKEYRRQQELDQEKVNARKSLEQAKNQFERLKARQAGMMQTLRLLNLDLAKIEKGELTPRARFYADQPLWVSDVKVNKGTFAAAGNSLMELVSSEHVHAELTVFEQDVPQLKKGQTFTFSVAGDTAVRHGNIYLIGRTVNTDRTIQVHGHLLEEDETLMPGTFIHATLNLPGEEMLCVPATALLHWNGKEYVFIKTGEQDFTMEEVQVLANDGNWMALPDSFSGKQIVTEGAFQLLSALKNEGEEE